MPAAPRAAQTSASAITPPPTNNSPTARRRGGRSRVLAARRAPSPNLPPLPSRAHLTLRALFVGALFRGPNRVDPTVGHRFLSETAQSHARESDAALDAFGCALEAAARLDAGGALDVDAVRALFEQIRVTFALLSPKLYRASQLSREAVALDAAADLLAGEAP